MSLSSVASLMPRLIGQPTSETPRQKASASLLLFAGKKKLTKTDAQQTGLYAGSFDPPTNGHVGLVRQAAQFLKRVIVAIAVNPSKKPMFTAEQRKAMFEEALKDCPNVQVQINPANRYTAQIAKESGAGVLIRGMRHSAKDLEEEMTLLNENRQIDQDIQTLFIPAPPGCENLSSSLVKSHLGCLDWRDQIVNKVPPMVFAALKQQDLQKRWDSLMKELTIKPEDGQELFQKLTENYGPRKAGYHNFDHILDCLERLDLYLNGPTAKKPKNLPMFKLALWFHDIYQGDKGIAKSADEAVNVLFKAQTLGVERPATRDYVKSLILATDHNNNAAITPDSDEALLCDIDLSVLGQPSDKYKAYAKSVRQEYRHVEASVFKAKRAEILEAFLNQPQIYRTPWFQAKYEAQARENLKKEIKALRR
jgi:pantetheine-phosphate adenylyltransferase